MDWTAVLDRLKDGGAITAAAVLVWLASRLYVRTMATLGRFGERVGRVEAAQLEDRHTLHLEQIRRWQLESFLIAAGDQLPPWPDQPGTVVSPPRHAYPTPNRRPTPTRSTTP